MTNTDHALIAVSRGYTYRGFYIVKSGKLVHINRNDSRVQTKTTITEACAWVDNQIDNTFGKVA